MANHYKKADTEDFLYVAIIISLLLCYFKLYCIVAGSLVLYTLFSNCVNGNVTVHLNMNLNELLTDRSSEFSGTKTG